MSGNIFYPWITVERDGIRRTYRPHGEADMDRIQKLFDEHPHRIYLDIANSTAEITFIKGTISPLP
jgi:hypothetical protein